LTAGVLGTATTSLTYAAAASYLDEVPQLDVNIRLLCYLLMLLTAFKLLGEATVLLHLFDRKLGDLKRTALLLRGQLLRPLLARLGLGAVGGLLLPLLLTVSLSQLSRAGGLVFLAISAVLLLLGELLERMLFFKALSAPKMPGAIA
jgi:hypothetical protein